MRLTDYENIRGRLRLLDPTRVRVSFFSMESDVGCAGFECYPCEEGMVWDERKGWWVCKSCGYELTPNEAKLLLKRTRKLMRILGRDVRMKRRRFWPWRM